MENVERPYINKLYLLGFVCLNLGIMFALTGWVDSLVGFAIALCYGGLFTVSKFKSHLGRLTGNVRCKNIHFQGAFGGISFTGLAEIAKRYDSSHDLMKGLGICSSIQRNDSIR